MSAAFSDAGLLATFTYDQPPECKWDVYETAKGASITRSTSCMDAPCYAHYLDARNAERVRLAGAVAGEVVTAWSYIGPRGVAIRIIKMTSSFVTTPHLRHRHAARPQPGPCTGHGG